jgi:hypothetical protein
MIRRLCASIATALLAGSSVAAPADVGVFETLYCIPHLPATRVLSEFSRLLEGDDCGMAVAKQNLGTHIVAVGECRIAPAIAGTDLCKTFSFQINNASTITAQASGTRFVLKGNGRWCRRSNGDWYPDEPEQITRREIMVGPSPPDVTCRVPEAWYGPLPVVAAPSAPVPPSPPVPPSTTVGASPPPPFSAPFRAPAGPTVGTYITAPPAPPVSSPPPPPPPPPEIVAAAPQAVAVAPAARPLAIVPPPPPPARPLCQAGYAGVCGDLVALHYLDAGDASDLVFGRAVREFLLDERVAVPTGVPPSHELERLTAAALARSRAAPACPTDPRIAGPIVACGRS